MRSSTRAEAPRVRDFQPGDLPSGERVVVFGAGDVAELLLHALAATTDVVVTSFVDPLADDTEVRRIDGVPVLSASALDQLAPGTVVFDAWDHTRYARQPELLARFARVFVAPSLLNQVDLASVPAAVAPGIREQRAQHYRSLCSVLLEGADDALRLRSVDVTVTEACTMRCVDCSNLMQYYARPRHSDQAGLLESLDRILEAVDRVDEFRVLGGEPFANPRVGEVIEYLVATPKSDRVVIYTNATIVPRPAILEAMRDDKVLVKITDYGELSTRHQDLGTVLTELGIAWVSQTPVWTDSGRIGHVDRTPAELQRTFSDCCVNDLLTLLNGKLYLCPFSANAMNLDAVPHAAADVIDLGEPRTPAQLRESITALYFRREPLSACAFCRGRDHTSPEIEVARQVRRPLDLPLIPLDRVAPRPDA